MKVAGRAHHPAQVLLVHVERTLLLVKIVEQLKILALCNPWDRVFLFEALPLVQPPGTFGRIARPADPDSVVGDVRAATTSGEDVFGSERTARCPAVDACTRILVLVQPFPDRGRPHDLSVTELHKPAHLEGPGI